MAASFLSDARYALRLFSQNRLLTAVAVGSLGLSTGANTAVFSVVYDMLLRPLPVREPSRLVVPYRIDRRRGELQLPLYSDFERWRERSDAFEAVAFSLGEVFTLTEGGLAERAWGELVSSNFFDLLGVEPALGRLPTGGDAATPDGTPVCVVSHRFWRTRLGGEPGVLGRTLQAGPLYLTVVGVLHESFERWHGAQNAGEIWAPIETASALSPMNLRNDVFQVTVVARLKPGLNLRTAESALEPDVRLVPLPEDLAPPRVRNLILLLAAAVTLVLLLACANTANLLLSLAGRRQKEMAIRAACGATGSQLVRQSLAEGLVLAAMSGAVGVVLAFVGTELLLRFRPGLLLTLEPRVNLPVLAFNFAVAGLTGLAVGLAPALQVLRHHRHHLAQPLKGGPAFASGPRPLRSGELVNSLLAISQVVIALLLLMGTGLTLKSFLRLQRVGMVSRPDRVLVTLIGLPPERYPIADRRKRASYVEQVLERVSAIPDVEAADAAIGIPVLGSGQSISVFLDNGRVFPEEHGERATLPGKHWVGPDHFRVLGLAVQRGRGFTPGDRLGAPSVAIINESFARAAFPAEEPIGRRIRPEGTNALWAEIVGVVQDTRYGSPRNAIKSELYVPFLQEPRTALHLLVRTRGTPQRLTPTLNAALRSVDSLVPVGPFLTMEDAIGRTVFETRYSAFLLSVLGGLALVLASAGVYSLISYNVSRRLHEFGVRAALGARPRDLRRLVLRKTLVLAFVGCTLGLGAARSLTRLLGSFLFEVTPTDPVTFATIPLFLVAIAIAATLIPAGRAAAVDPVVALRQE